MCIYIYPECTNIILIYTNIKLFFVSWDHRLVFNIMSLLVNIMFYQQTPTRACPGSTSLFKLISCKVVCRDVHQGIWQSDEDEEMNLVLTNKPRLVCW